MLVLVPVCAHLGRAEFLEDCVLCVCVPRLSSVRISGSGVGGIFVQGVRAEPGLVGGWVHI